MKKVFYLKTCSTCKRILNEVDTTGFELREVKGENITKEELHELRKHVDSYNDLINRRGRFYAQNDLKNKNLSDAEWEELLLQEYSLLKRPVFIDGDLFYAGNSKKTVEQLKEKFGEK